MGRKNEHGQSELALAELHWKPLIKGTKDSVCSRPDV